LPILSCRIAVRFHFRQESRSLTNHAELLFVSKWLQLLNRHRRGVHNRLNVQMAVMDCPKRSKAIDFGFPNATALLSLIGRSHWNDRVTKVTYRPAFFCEGRMTARSSARAAPPERASVTTHTEPDSAAIVCVLCGEVLSPLPRTDPTWETFGCSHRLCPRCYLTLREIEGRERVCPICRHLESASE
jgi:hypothetical protein